MKLIFNFAKLDDVVMLYKQNDSSDRFYLNWNLCIEEANEFYGSLSSTELDEPDNQDGWKKYELKRLL